MSKEEKWKHDLDTYIHEKEPSTVEKTYAWETAIGLQAVDGLETSDYLLDVAKKHIEGDINIYSAKSLIADYYKTKGEVGKKNQDTKEADFVSTRIAELINEQAFRFSVIEYKDIHKRLFEDILIKPGQFREYNITKKEWVLNGDSVLYVPFGSIKESIEYDFNKESDFTYKGVPIDEAVKHITKFASDIWQVHCFGEGNTRTTAVFLIKYLKTFGFQINNEMFANNSWYFRNALVRSNYENYAKGIYKNTEYLERFFRNLLLGENYPLKNRFLHVDNDENVKRNRDNFCAYTLEEIGIMDAIKSNPKVTQKELAKVIGKSERSVKRIMDKLKKEDMIVRENSKKTGLWKVKQGD